MHIHLKPIDKSNYESIVMLEVTETQEEFVASNMFSLVEAAYDETLTVRGIYNGDIPVGFFMWKKASDLKIEIWRFMVDKSHQKLGIGRKALELALNEIKQDTLINEIEICYDPLNPIAKPFYASFGFKEIGLDDEGEEMLAVILF